MLCNFSTKYPFDKKRETRFVQKIADKTKQHTFRQGFRWTAGDVANVYTGARTKAAKKHFDKKIWGVAPVLILFGETDIMGDGSLMLPDKKSPIIYWDGWDISEHAARVAEYDGFDSLGDFCEWFYMDGGGYGAFVGQGLCFMESPAVFMLNYSVPTIHGEHVAAIKLVFEGARICYETDKERFRSLDYRQEIRETVLNLRQASAGNVVFH